MRRHLMPALAAVLLATSAAATAAPARPCLPIILDEAGGPASLDLRRADVGIGRNEIVTVLHLGSTDTAREPLTMLGADWMLMLRDGGVDILYELRRQDGPVTGRKDTARLSVGGTDVPVTVVVGPTTITWRAPRKAYLPLLRPRAGFVDAAANSSALRGTMDSALGKAYWEGNRLCGTG